MRPALLAALAACKFHQGGAPIDAGADARPDAGRDASNEACMLAATDATGMDRGKVGLSTGGGTIGMLACDSGNLVGIALDMSTGGVNGTQVPSAHGIEIACADVSIDGSGGHTGAVTTKLRDGNGGAGFTPSALTAVARCQDGAVVTGLAVHGSMYTSFFLDAAIACTSYDPAGHIAAVATVPITGSGTDSNNPSMADCNPGEVVVSMATDTGAGLDSLHLWCAPVACDSTQLAGISSTVPSPTFLPRNTR